MKRVASAAFNILLALAPVLFALTIILIFALMVSAAPPRARDDVKLPRARDEVKVPAQPEVVKPAVIEEEDMEAARIEDERQERYQRYRSSNPWNFQWGNPSRCLGGS